MNKPEKSCKSCVHCGDYLSIPSLIPAELAVCKITHVPITSEPMIVCDDAMFCSDYRWDGSEEDVK